MTTQIMELIKQTIGGTNPSIADLIKCIDLVKAHGNVVALKLDGLRAENQYTAFITFPPDQGREMIRADDNSIELALLRVLKSYVDA